MTVKVRPYRGRDGEFEVDIRVAKLADGLPYRERLKAPVTSRSAALRWGQDREGFVIRHGRPKEESTKKLTFSEFVPIFIRDHLEANRIKASHQSCCKSLINFHLMPMFGEMVIDDIDAKHVTALVGRLSKKKPNTVNNIMTMLRTMLNRAHDWGHREKSAPKMRLLKVESTEMAFYDYVKVQRLVDAATELDPRYLVLVLLGCDAGLRAGEIIALELSDVDFVRGQMTIRHSEWSGIVGTPKSGKLRRIPLTKALLAALKAVRHLRGPRVLYHDSGESVSIEALSTWMERVQRKAGMKVDGKLHIMRHSFCSHLAMRGATAKAIQELAGHKDLTTTQRYMHLSPAAKNEAVALLEKRGEIREMAASEETTTTGGSR